MSFGNLVDFQMKYPVKNSLLVLREEFDEWSILFNPDDGMTFVLNPVSGFIWKRLDGRHSAGDITAELRDVCKNVPEHAEASVDRFIQELVGKGYAGYEVDVA